MWAIRSWNHVFSTALKLYSLHDKVVVDVGDYKDQLDEQTMMNKNAFLFEELELTLNDQHNDLHQLQGVLFHARYRRVLQFGS